MIPSGFTSSTPPPANGSAERFDVEPRRILIDRIASGAHPDIIIIGGGCNGAGLFRDLALQSVPTLLVDKGDFGSGASAAPTRLAHGGLKYLETGEISLVKESAEERNLMLINAPHQVRPLPVWVPVRSWFGGAMLAPLRFLGLTKRLGRKGAVAMKAGLIVYDRFGERHRTLPKHSTCSRSRALSLVPQLSPDIRLAAQYHDALIDQPERLVMEMIGDGESDCPAAMAVPYMTAAGMNGGGVALRDEAAGTTYTVKPRLVVNMTGPWADETSRSLGLDGNMVGGTKGSHVAVRNKALADALDGRMLYFEADDFRACIVLPLGGDRLFLGATDIRTDDPEDRRCSDEEIDYIFGVMRSVLPDVTFSRDDIVYTVAGVRPLPRADVPDPGLISRDHRLHEFPATRGRPFPVFTLIGGKWTTYRACAEHAADAVLAHIGKPRKASTRELAIGGGRGFPRGQAEQDAWAAALAERTGLGPGRAEALARRYGARAEAVAEAEAAHPDGGLIAGFSPAEIAWIVKNERVTKLEDIVQRRTLMAFEGKATRRVLDQTADVAAPILGWDEGARQAEIDAAASLLTRRHRMTLEAA